MVAFGRLHVRRWWLRRRLLRRVCRPRGHRRLWRLCWRGTDVRRRRQRVEKPLVRAHAVAFENLAAVEALRHLVQPLLPARKRELELGYFEQVGGFGFVRGGARGEGFGGH